MEKWCYCDYYEYGKVCTFHIFVHVSSLMRCLASLRWSCVATQFVQNNGWVSCPKQHMLFEGTNICLVFQFHMPCTSLRHVLKGDWLCKSWTAPPQPVHPTSYPKDNKIIGWLGQTSERPTRHLRTENCSASCLAQGVKMQAGIQEQCCGAVKLHPL